MVKLTILKVGYIGSTPLLDAIFDERASRKDLSIKVFSSGCKMDVAEVTEIAEIAASVESDLIIIVSPNAVMAGPKKAREILKKLNKPLIVITDAPGKKGVEEYVADGFGYILLQADPMIGAKAAFLDPIEMALFNADVIRVLSVTGVFRLVHTVIDKVLKQIENGEEVTLPQLNVNKEKAVKYSGILNPYARAKAMASFEMARRAASLSSQGTFKVEDRERYLPILAAAHEMVRQAAILADEAREIEKYNDTVSRTVHFKKGSLHTKVKLLDKFEKK